VANADRLTGSSTLQWLFAAAMETDSQTVSYDNYSQCAMSRYNTTSTQQTRPNYTHHTI